MTIEYLENVDSTQSYLKLRLAENSIQSPYAVVSKMQTDGKGSRNNSWLGLSGNLFLSFAIPVKKLPKDLRLESASIYFAYLLKEILNEHGSAVWLKWPNDFYINNLKIGGMITNVSNDDFICGVGINLLRHPTGSAKLDIKIDIEKLLEEYFMNIDKSNEWKKVFSKYKLEFHKSKNFSTHKNNLKFSLGDALLECDGSITINGERMYSLR